MGAVLLLLLAVLPSALNLPQSNPATTLEYAPVPPSDGHTPPAANGNLASLGLASSASVASRGAGGAGGSGAESPPEVDNPAAAGPSPSSKRCVGNPPRQTEDPLSPPCVAHFSGDNFGATYQGVTAEEVRVVVYFEGCATQSGGSRGRDPLPCNSYIDMAEPPAANENVFAATVRIYQRYFNERYQTYGRFVHFWAYFDGGADSVEGRRADAADNIAKIKPFAAMIGSAFTYSAEWEKYMASRGVVVFRNAQTDRATCCTSVETFDQFAPRLWSVAASTEEYSRIAASALCARVVGRPVTFSGMPSDMGKPRKFGIVVNRDSGYEEVARHAKLVRAQVEGCGGAFAQTADNTYSPDEGAAIMARFRDAGVTTIIWPGGVAGSTAGLDMSQAAAAIGYYPEVVFSGDGLTEITLNGELLNQQFARNIMAITPYTRADVAAERPCYQAARESDPSAPEIDLQNIACPAYDEYRLLFTGIQVAGPRLGPTSIDKGFHAIPGIASSDARVPACFFHAGDFTCVKDAMIEWWDPAGQDPGTAAKGCMRMVEGGRRYLEGAFPDLDIAANRAANDPCNRQGTVVA